MFGLELVNAQVSLNDAGVSVRFLITYFGHSIAFGEAFFVLSDKSAEGKY